MTEFVLKNAYFLLDGRDFACQLNEINFDYSAELQDRTAICDTNRRRVPGLLDFSGTLNGFWASTTDSTGSYVNGSPPGDIEIDQIFFNKVGQREVPFAMGISKTTGSASYFGQGIHGTYDIGAAIGELLMINISFQGSGDTPLIRGQVGLSGYSTALTRTGPTIDGAAAGIGALTSTETLYAGAFIQGSTGGTCDISIVSSSDNFATSTTRATFTQFTSTGAEMVQVAGPITDTQWRVQVTQGSNPAFNLLVSIGKK